MKTAQEMVNEFDRVSTHEELHQVLALLNECTPSEGAGAPSESDEKLALREAVASLWRDAPNEETGSRTDPYSWAEMLVDKSDRIN